MNPLHKPKALNTKTNGFTLIEIMITIAIIGIITVSAWPSYERYQQKGRRTVGINALLENRARVEKCFINYGTYANANCGILIQPDPRYYDITFARFAEAYTLTAFPVGAQQGDGECGTLWINQLGVKGFLPTNVAPDPVGTLRRCWSQ